MKKDHLCIFILFFSMTAFLSGCNPTISDPYNLKDLDDDEIETWYYVVSAYAGNSPTYAEITGCVNSSGEALHIGSRATPWTSPTYKRAKDAPSMEIGINASAGGGATPGYSVSVLVFLNGVMVAGNGGSYCNYPGPYYSSGASTWVLHTIGDLHGFSVKYYDKSCTSGHVPEDNTKYREGDLVTVLGNPGRLEKVGSILTDWSTVENGDGYSYQEGGTFIMPAGNIKLYSQWSRIGSN